MTKTEWIAAAHARFVRWASHKRVRGTQGTFEALRGHVAAKLDEPADLRWWGAVASALVRDGVIVRTAWFAPAKSSHDAAKRVWVVRG
jgi:hypothetical protein